MSIQATNFQLPKQIGFYQGKVRDVYYLEGNQMVTVATDRISAFDVILPRTIPYKGQVLNQIAWEFLEMTRDIVPNWAEASPHPQVTVGKKCEPFAVEMVIRGYLAGHAAREYKAGKRQLCGEVLPEGLKENDPLPSPIITPTTKAKKGHDEDISKDEIIRRGLVSSEYYELLEYYTHALFKKGTEVAKQKGLILVDTKYEFGLYEGKIHLIDEVHTPDSSRYFYADTYEENQRKGLPQRQLSKEFVRQWLIENNFQGKEGQQIPTITDEVVEHIAKRYQELYEQILGKKFIPCDNSLKFIHESIIEYLNKN